ncbi:hypothetical protein QTP70_001009 [Hemibagrus guttatus]|uniref:Retropepsins domain-containing protein n=1 Tax=Hemibagrus guttatus TaxID=175788 RepID=A0AAE0R8T4_9TELE|nr:hypothetical protein QTP70_001009 [Hemibagrus guttatus]
MPPEAQRITHNGIASLAKSRRITSEVQCRRGPVDEPMPTKPELPPPARASKPWLAGCVLHAAAAPKAPRVTVELNGRSVPALLDSGSTVTLIQITTLPRPTRLAGTMPVLCVHGNVWLVPSVQVCIRGPAGKWPLIAGVIPNLPVPVLLGWYWPGFLTIVKASTPVRWPRSPRTRTKPACMAHGAPDTKPSSPA